MLVPFVIDAESLAPDAHWPLPVQRACHRQVLDIWRRIGVLVYDGPSLLQSRLYGAVQNLPQALRSDWQKMLERGPVLPAAAWGGTVDVMSLDQLVMAARVALVEDARAEVEFQLQDQDEDVRNANGREISICRIVAATAASPFSSARDLSGMPILETDTFDDIWELRFSQLARADLRNITVVDRYGVSKHFKRQVNATNGLSGLARFLRMLDRTASGKRTVTVFSQWTQELNRDSTSIADIEGELRQILTELPNNRISLKVYMVKKDDFKRDSHDRFIRFGDYLWDIGSGLEVFEGAHAPRWSAASFKTGKTVIDSYMQVESELKANRGVSRFELH